jgi:AcrR family transcriptional regulator
MPRRKRHQPLDHDRILTAANALISKKGLDGWSMRGLAGELGVEPMSLYHWFPSRAHVLDGLVDRFALRLEIAQEGAWTDRLRATAHSFKQAAESVPSFFPYLALHRFNTAVALARLEAMLRLFAERFPEPERRAAAFRLFTHWLVGFLLDATSGFAKGPSAVDPPSDAWVAEQFPITAALAPYNRPEHLDALFENELAAILRALATE